MTERGGAPPGQDTDDDGRQDQDADGVTQPPGDESEQGLVARQMAHGPQGGCPHGGRDQRREHGSVKGEPHHGQAGGDDLPCALAPQQHQGQQGLHQLGHAPR